jgi:hypothetical protein
MQELVKRVQMEPKTTAKLRLTVVVTIALLVVHQLVEQIQQLAHAYQMLVTHTVHVPH